MSACPTTAAARRVSRRSNSSSLPQHSNTSNNRASSCHLSTNSLGSNRNPSTQAWENQAKLCRYLAIHASFDLHDANQVSAIAVQRENTTMAATFSSCGPRYAALRSLSQGTKSDAAVNLKHGAPSITNRATTATEQQTTASGNRRVLHQQQQPSSLEGNAMSLT